MSEKQIAATRALQSRIAKRGRSIAQLEAQVSNLKDVRAALRVFGQKEDAKRISQVIFQGRKVIKGMARDQQLDRALFRALTNCTLAGLTIIP